jgi:phosphatidylglycerol:prolipoprotein diacylglycerol transferase
MEFTPTGIVLFGTLQVHYYGILIIIGVVVGSWITYNRAQQRGMQADMVWDGLVYVIIGGVIGARIWHVLTPPASMIALGYTTKYYLTHPLDILAVWQGGLGIPGAIIGGGIAVYWFARKHNQSWLAWADCAMPGLALGQAIGRWGNFINQELYGAPTNLPWAIRIDPQYRLKGYENVSYYHPLFLYESLWNLANMGFLLWLDRRYGGRLKEGDLVLVYGMTYGVGRFALDFLRLDISEVASLNVNQTLMGVVALGCAALFYIRHRAANKLDEETKEE